MSRFNPNLSEEQHDKLVSDYSYLMDTLHLFRGAQCPDCQAAWWNNKPCETCNGTHLIPIPFADLGMMERE